MKDYAHIAPHVTAPDPQFDVFYGRALQAVPNLESSGAMRISADGFKRALKTAYIAGKMDMAEQFVGELEPETLS